MYWASKVQGFKAFRVSSNKGGTGRALDLYMMPWGLFEECLLFGLLLYCACEGAAGEK